MKKVVLCICFCALFIVPVDAKLSSIEGESLVEIAQQGESLSLYQAEEGYTFSLLEPVEGVRITPQGELYVNASAKERNVILIASKGNDTLHKEITLVASWTTKSEHGKQFGIPSPTNARRITNIERDTIIKGVQITLVALGIAFLMLYRIARKRERKE